MSPFPLRKTTTSSQSWAVMSEGYRAGPWRLDFNAEGLPAYQQPETHPGQGPHPDRPLSGDEEHHHRHQPVAGVVLPTSQGLASLCWCSAASSLRKTCRCG